MAVKKFKPVTAGTRHKIIGTFDEITTIETGEIAAQPQEELGWT